MELNCNTNNDAFSLLEVLISIAILSIGLIAIMQAFSFSAQATGLSCDIIKAVFLAEDKLQELEFKENQNLIDEEPKEIKAQMDKFGWGYTINLDEDLNLYKLSFDITWKRKAQEGFDLNTYLRNEM